MDLFEVVEKRRSIRKFKPNSVAEKDLKKILEAGQLAPSDGNRQPWYFVVVKNEETKNALSTAANNQKFITDAGVVIAALADSSGYPRSSSSQAEFLTCRTQ
ncbi:MAG: nitroreductase family protein [Candidatus Bathyarchaeota archaeon]|nr:nitroreductase family protein [Candidatus Bathyarchaeota archaeon]MDH5786828.1 nitroreductase family protein [Candidatus Bathyarchaeota archaeon]